MMNLISFCFTAKNHLLVGRFLSLWAFLLITGSIHAQVPQAFNYQAVCRNTNGAPILNQPVNFQIEILQGSITGTVVYAETQRDTTSAFGVSTLEIGRGTPTSGTFAGINWGNTPTFIRISFDTTGTNNFILLGTHELLSVPYALYSGNGLPNGTTQNEMIYWNGSNWVKLNPGSNGFALSLCHGSLSWIQNNQCPTVTSINCGGANHIGTLTSNSPASGVSSSLAYTGGNGASFTGYSVASAGVPGLTAILDAGVLNSGNGTISYSIVGTPAQSGTAVFSVNLGGQNCSFNRIVN
jgi:hypothetical protein